MSSPATASKPAADAPAAAVTTITLPAIAEGEHYAGIALTDEGRPSHHLILLPGELERATWKKALEWAKEQRGDLPTRQEQSLLFANAKQHFQPAWYWSGEQHAPAAAYAWLQYFYNGYQGNDHKDDACRARAVRRVTI